MPDRTLRLPHQKGLFIALPKGMLYVFHAKIDCVYLPIEVLCLSCRRGRDITLPNMVLYPK